MAGHSFPVSLGLPRCRPRQIPDPGATLKCQNPYPGEGTLAQFPVGSPPPPPPPPPTLELNIDRCISFEHFMTSFLWSIRACRPWKIVVDLLIKFNHLSRNRAQFPCRGDKWANNRVRSVGKTKRRTNSVFF